MPFTIAHTVTFEEEIKKSRFQAIAAVVENEQQVKAFLEQTKDSSTTHQCNAGHGRLDTMYALMMMMNPLEQQVVLFWQP